ncbi:MAG: choice-of-anchor Q domain-containing protein [Chloroflexota bacterium]
MTVTNNLDSGAGSLRDTIAAALTGDIIQFAPAVTGTITLNSAITLDHGLTISGPGAAILAIDGNNANQIFNITSGAINLSGLTIKRGKNAAAGGGAIVNSSALNITNSTLSNNTANGYGGAITNLGTLNVTSSTFSGNQGTYGGAISSTGTLIISNSTFSANKAATSGGAIYNTSGVTIIGSTFSSNQALSGSGIGGAILSNGGLISATNSTLTANSASNGAAIYDLNATLNLINSTVAANTATTGNGDITVDSSTLTLRSTIVAGNTGATQDIAGAVSSDGFNLIGNTATATGSFIASDQLNVAPLLNPLAPNTPGTSQTMSLKTNSPAIGKGGAACPSPDQRGLPRKSLCDVGAYEIQPAIYSATPAAGSSIALGATVGFSDTRTITISNVGELPLTVNTFILGLSAPLSASPANLTVSVGIPKTVTITCTPTAGRTIAQTLLYLTNDPSHPAVGYSVSCTGNPYPKDTIGVFRPSTHTFYLRRTNTTGFADITSTYGDSNSLPIVGDWNGDGIDTVGVYDKTTGLFSLSDSGTPSTPTYQLD